MAGRELDLWGVRMSSKKEAAIGHAALGLRVFPCATIKDGECDCWRPDCKSPGKHPKIKDWPEAASTDTRVISGWWDRWPDANIGIATGSGSGVWVLDLDGPEAFAALKELEATNGELPPTATVATSRGEHRYFRWTDGLNVRLAKPFAKADTRGERGFVVAPPSNHKSGTIYLWRHSPQDVGFAVAPPWLVQLAQTPCTEEKRAVAPSLDDLFTELTGDLDLETASGAPDGSRHNRAVQLIGSALGRGVSLPRVTASAVEWARRCDPPFEQEELIQIIEWAAQKEEGKLAESGVANAPDWPVMEPAAFHGLAGEIVKLIEPETESDPAALLLQLLVFFGAVVGRKPHTIVEATTHYPNLFLVIVGQSSKGRKGTSADWIRKVYQGTTDPFPFPREINGLSSGEGLISAVRDPAPAPQQSRAVKLPTRHEPPAERGVSDKRLLVVEPEFQNVLSAMRREGNLLSGMLRNAWDGAVLNNQVKNFPMTATGAHISMIGHITLEELRSKWPEVEAFNGFANRYLWACTKRSKLLPEGGRDIDLSEYRERLRERIDFATRAERMERDDEAKRLWADLYTEMAQAPAGLLGSVTARGEPQVLRLAMNYALLDGSVVVRREHLEAAYAVWRYCEASARYIFGDSTGNATADRLLKAIRERPQPMTELHKLFGGHRAGTDLRNALQRLVGLKLIRCEKLSTGGRPSEVWHPA